MPLKMGTSEKTFSHNVRAEMNSGRSQSQSLAIAYAKKRESEKRKKMWIGGMVEPDFYKSDETEFQQHPEESESHMSTEQDDFDFDDFSNEEEEETKPKKSFAHAMYLHRRFK